MIDAVLIAGTNFTSNSQHFTYSTDEFSVIKSNSRIRLEGPIVIQHNTFNVLLNSSVQLCGYIEISQNRVGYLLFTSFHTSVNLIQNIVLNITRNYVIEEIFHNEQPGEIIPPCYFQFYTTHKNNVSTKSYTVLISHTNSKKVFATLITGSINCKMLPGSEFYDHNPLQVYQNTVHFQNESGHFPLFDTGLLCYCSNNTKQDCLNNTLGPIYPGQK